MSPINLINQNLSLQYSFNLTAANQYLFIFIRFFRLGITLNDETIATGQRAADKRSRLETYAIGAFEGSEHRLPDAIGFVLPD